MSAPLLMATLYVATMCIAFQGKEFSDTSHKKDLAKSCCWGVVLAQTEESTNPVWGSLTQAQHRTCSLFWMCWRHVT